MHKKYVHVWEFYSCCICTTIVKNPIGMRSHLAKNHHRIYKDSNFDWKSLSTQLDSGAIFRLGNQAVSAAVDTIIK